MRLCALPRFSSLGCQLPVGATRHFCSPALHFSVAADGSLRCGGFFDGPLSVHVVGQHRCNKKDSSTTVLLGVVGSTAIFLFSFVFFLLLLAQTPTPVAWLGPPRQCWNPLLRAASVAGRQVGRQVNYNFMAPRCNVTQLNLIGQSWPKALF